MKITRPTYLIAELGGDVVPLVLEMRKRFNPDNIYWPADITIAGSSGVGPLMEGQELDDVVTRLMPIVCEPGFLAVNFVGIHRFPDTGIYYLEPEREGFDLMHKAVVGSGVKFNESAWPYNPHCTLRWHDFDSPECEGLFQSIALPEKSFVDCFSLYQPEIRGGHRVHKF